MSMEYLEQLEVDINSGLPYYACPGSGANEWFISTDVEKCRQRAQRTANANRFDAIIYRLVNKMDTTTGDAFLAVRKILEVSSRGEPNIRWMLVDTREAAELLRDVSQGPTPYFGLVVDEQCVSTEKKK